MLCLSRALKFQSLSILKCLHINFTFNYSPATSCPAGMVYQQCGPICPQTCLGGNKTCYGGCAEGCFCPDGQMVNDQGLCVSMCTTG